MTKPRVHSERRHFCKLLGGAFAWVVTDAACKSKAARGTGSDGRLSARPRPNARTSVSGQLKLDSDSGPAILQMPKDFNSPLPLLVMLHGAGQEPEDMFWYLGSTPDETEVAVLAPKSRDHTWDGISDEFGPDVTGLNRLLAQVFEQVDVDSQRLTIGGFSDGATYALSLGLINGDLFSRVVAFSPGFIVDGVAHGRPGFFVSHGTKDRILPIDSCSRRITATLKTRGYEVLFREFDGGHEIPANVAREGLSWISGK